jgi:predicted nuclease of predicted toxin-antitoxin system
MRFLVDTQLPPALARWIAAQDHAAEHVAIALAPTEPDAAIVQHAIENGAVIITEDSDFLTLAPPPPMLIVTTGNITNQVLIALFGERFDTAVGQLAKGQTVVEIDTRDKYR